VAASPESPLETVLRATRVAIAVAGERLSGELVAENPDHVGPRIARRSVHQMSGWLTFILLRHGVERLAEEMTPGEKSGNP